MTDVLEVVGLLALVVGAFFLAVWLGFVALGAGCLWVSASVTRRKREAAEALRRRRELVTR